MPASKISGIKKNNVSLDVGYSSNIVKPSPVRLPNLKNIYVNIDIISFLYIEKRAFASKKRSGLKTSFMCSLC